MDENKINSYHNAEVFLQNMFGEPDYFSKTEDITEIEEYLNQFRTEHESLERYAKNVSYENANQFKLNRCIALHFLLKAGDDYIGLLHDVVYSNDYEKQLAELDEVVDSVPEWNDFTTNKL